MSIKLHASMHGTYLCCLPPFHALEQDDAVVALPCKSPGQPQEERKRYQSERRFELTVPFFISSLMTSLADHVRRIGMDSTCTTNSCRRV